MMKLKNSLGKDVESTKRFITMLIKIKGDYPKKWTMYVQDYAEKRT